MNKKLLDGISLATILVVLAASLAGLLLAVLGVNVLGWFTPEPEKVAPQVVAPGVQVVEVKKEPVRLKVSTQGTVLPRTESTLSSEVPGRVVHVAEAFESGGFFEKGDILVEMDRRDYEIALVSAKASVAQAQMNLELELAEADQARREWESIGEGEPSDLVLRKPQLAEARASLEAAKAAYEQAKINLERTSIKAPYAGRVREKHVDVGQYVGQGTTLARVYGIDDAEVRLPLSAEELALIDVPRSYRGEAAKPDSGPEVTLSFMMGSERNEWKGRLVRLEGEVDSDSRMFYAVARVEDPYGQKHSSANQIPLSVGMFVNAEIQGKLLEGAVSIPAGSLRGADTVFVVDGEDRLWPRKVEVASFQDEWIIVRGGLSDSDRVSLTPLAVVVDGMKVKPEALKSGEGQTP